MSSAHTYTSTRTVGAGEDLQSAFDNAVLGFVLLIVGLALIAWNEGHAFRRHSALREGMRRVISMVSSFINPDLEGQLVHTKGKLVAGGPSATKGVQDDLFGIRLPNALKLTRDVWMYQWVEHVREWEEDVNDSRQRRTVTTYQPEWKEYVVHSNTFEKEFSHENPQEMRFVDREYAADPIELGAFNLSPDVVELLDWFEDYLCHSAESIPDPKLREEAQEINNGFYFGKGSQQSPQIGDHKVLFQIVPERTVTLVAQQTGCTFKTYEGRHQGSVLFLQQGEKEALEMFKDAQSDLAFQTNLWRFFGILLLFVGFFCSLTWISHLLYFVPFMGRHLSSLAEFLFFVVALLLAILLGSLTIALSWFLRRGCILCCEGDCSLKDCSEIQSLEKLHQRNSKRFLGYEAVPPVEVAEKISPETLSLDPVPPSAYQHF